MISIIWAENSASAPRTEIANLLKQIACDEEGLWCAFGQSGTYNDAMDISSNRLAPASNQIQDPPNQKAMYSDPSEETDNQLQLRLLGAAKESYRVMKTERSRLKTERKGLVEKAKLELKGGGLTAGTQAVVRKALEDELKVVYDFEAAVSDVHGLRSQSKLVRRLTERDLEKVHARLQGKGSAHALGFAFEDLTQRPDGYKGQDTEGTPSEPAFASELDASELDTVEHMHDKGEEASSGSKLKRLFTCASGLFSQDGRLQPGSVCAERSESTVCAPGSGRIRTGFSDSDTLCGSGSETE